MSITTMEFPEVWLTEGDDARLSREIEAGIYAQHLLAQGTTHHCHDELRRVADRGRASARLLWWVGLRMAMQASLKLAPRSGLPLDDLFQEACLAVAEAIRRFDHTRGVRFTTVTHGYIQRCLQKACDERMGHAPNSRWDRRAARLALEQQERMAAVGRAPSIDEAARLAGVTLSAVARGLNRLVALDDAFRSDPRAEAHFDRVDRDSVHVLDLLEERFQRLLRLRFGLGCQPHTLAQTAAALGTTTSTVYRWEREALTTARALLSTDRTTAASGRDRRRRMMQDQ